ncbi:MAG: thiamine phosphate synthase [Proteobacteria bacterium]|nr:thiamine phosphate synthase [Pseudomonadota bacterium]
MHNILLNNAREAKRRSKLGNNNKLPSFFFFTDRKRFSNVFDDIAALPKGSAVIIREYDLSYEKRLEFAQKVREIAKEKELLFLIAKNLKLAIETKAHGVHFTDYDQSWLEYLRFQKFCRKDFMFACSCHKPTSLIKADKLGFDALFYSPIFPTKSHPDRKALGVRHLQKASRNKKTAIYALGGVNTKNIKLLHSCNINGIAGISLFSNQN